MKVSYGRMRVGDVEMFYREAGPTDAPVVLLLHGFPTSGHMFRNLIPALADRYRVIAPDLPGFGNTVAPPRAGFEYSFDNLAKVIGGFVDALGLTRYALYIFDYGAPTGLRLAMKHPERVTAIVTQNGNAYVEGLSKEWEPWQAYWRNPTPENRERCRASLSDDAIRFQYLHGSPAELVAPDGFTLDMFYMARPEAHNIQLDLVLNYRTNVALYPRSSTISASASHRCWQFGARTTHSSSRPVRKPTSAIFLTPRSVSSIRDISRLRHIAMRSPRACGIFWPATLKMDGRVAAPNACADWHPSGSIRRDDHHDVEHETTSRR
jgi:pimeloyl-ACP methyl ester carboxylesterase